MSLTFTRTAHTLPMTFSLSLSILVKYLLIFPRKVIDFLASTSILLLDIKRVPPNQWLRPDPNDNNNNNDSSSINNNTNTNSMATTNGTTNGGPGASKRRVSENLVHSMTLKTCGGELAATLRELYPSFHRDTGAESIKLTVDYADTLVEGNTYDKVIVAIHGTPGYYTHFDKIIQHFRDTNVRVIAPNLPSFADTRRTKAFWHTTLEKGQFLKDFLARLNITTIDCLISHSFGIQTIATLWENVSVAIDCIDVHLD